LPGGFGCRGFFLPCRRPASLPGCIAIDRGSEMWVHGVPLSRIGSRCGETKKNPHPFAERGTITLREIYLMGRRFHMQTRFAFACDVVMEPRFGQLFKPFR